MLLSVCVQLAVAEKHPGSLPTKWFCRASDDEVKQALMAHLPPEQVGAHKRKTPTFKQ